MKASSALLATLPKDMCVCAVIPLYNHHHRIAGVVKALHAHKLPVIIVNDGSDEITHQALSALAKNTGSESHSAQKKLIIHHLPVNQGKGAAVLAGLHIAHTHGFSHAIQMDADGQHAPASLPSLLASAAKHPAAIISGKPVYDASVPKSRFYGRHINHFWVWLETLSLQLKDTMCGFRVYPVNAVLAISQQVNLRPRMEFDTEIMVRYFWAGYDTYYVPVRVDYPQDGLSHFRLWADNFCIVRMHTHLVFGMLRRLPRLFARLLKRHWPHPAGSAKKQARWSTISERGSLAGMRLMAALYRLLGKRVCALLLGPIALYYFLSHRTARRASSNFLQHVHPYTSGATAHDSRATAINSLRHFHSFATSLLDKMAAWHNTQKIPSPTVYNRDALQAELAKGRGLLLISAHLGNLELCRALSTMDAKPRINALVYTRNAKKFNQLLARSNARYQFRLFMVDQIGPDTGIRLRDLIAQGEIVVIVGDRTPVDDKSATTRANFLGQAAHFSIGPYILAHLLECPVQLLFCVREKNKHAIYLEHFSDGIHLPRTKRQQAIAALAQQYADRLAHYAARYPLQWFNFFDFWQTAPQQPRNKDKA